ncbi:MAG: hypothetical protein KBD66_01165 [Candidatus Doudnabacteria bacterium]|nr:hypothetical protein [Candidatus Doudnabacteria bacterium]
MKKIIFIVVVFSVLLAGGTWMYNWWQDKGGKPESQQAKADVQPTPIVSDKKEIKRFTLSPIGQSGVKGDGSMTLKTDLTSVGARLTEAPALSDGQSYEAYIKTKSGEYVRLGVFLKVDSKNEAFLFGAAGDTAAFTADKFFVAKRNSSEKQPGTIVAEVTLPTTGDPVQK